MWTRNPGLFFRLAVGFVIVGLPAIAAAADLPLQPYPRSSGLTDDNHAARASDWPDTRTPVSSRAATADHAPAIGQSIRQREPHVTTVGHLATARARFNEARAAMERGLLLRDTALKVDTTTLETAMRQFYYELTQASGIAPPISADSSQKAARLAQDWYQTGLKIINPPREGVLELPLPMNLRAKADAVTAALDELAEQTSAYASPASTPGSAKPRPHVSQSNGDETGTVGGPAQLRRSSQ